MGFADHGAVYTDLRVPSRGRTLRCAPTFRLHIFDRNSVLRAPRSWPPTPATPLLPGPRRQRCAGFHTFSGREVGFSSSPSFTVPSVCPGGSAFRGLGSKGVVSQNLGIISVTAKLMVPCRRREESVRGMAAPNRRDREARHGKRPAVPGSALPERPVRRGRPSIISPKA
jgi:hypothetical protein